MDYLDSYSVFKRLVTREVKIGNLVLGGEQPIVVQSMTTSNTEDTEKTVAEILRLQEAGCRLVRVTVPNLRAAENLANIKNKLLQKKQAIPLVADIHFTPSAALRAAAIVEKVRINPGNFSDRKHFKQVVLNEEDYGEELKKIADKFVPLLEVCKKNHTALRIGANHGSLSDRIVTRYGDSPLGMVHSALEFLEIAENHDFHEIVFSMKSSNPIVMVAAYRLLVKMLKERGRGLYPIHLGVTEAGDSDEGRIKSTLGIGTLLNDGIGDTVRVSLTEDSEKEIPVGEKIIKNFAPFLKVPPLAEVEASVNPYSFARQKTNKVLHLGGGQVPKVVLQVPAIRELKDLRELGFYKNPALDKWESRDVVPDFIVLTEAMEQKKMEALIPPQLKVAFEMKKQGEVEGGEGMRYFSSLSLYQKMNERERRASSLDFVLLQLADLSEMKKTSFAPHTVFVLEDRSPRPAWVLRNFIFHLKKQNFAFPLVLRYPTDHRSSDEELKTTQEEAEEVEEVEEDELVKTTSYFGPLLADGLVDGVMLASDRGKDLTLLFKILQASRQRVFKTEYISCPSCGRTLFDLQEVTAKIKEKTEHLKGVKIGIMGCIVNGPGEMADADFGYVGSGPGKITLYKGRNPVLKSIPAEKAVDELVALLKREGFWREKNIA